MWESYYCIYLPFENCERRLYFLFLSGKFTACPLSCWRAHAINYFSEKYNFEEKEIERKNNSKKTTNRDAKKKLSNYQKKKKRPAEIKNSLIHRSQSTPHILKLGELNYVFYTSGTKKFKITQEKKSASEKK